MRSLLGVIAILLATASPAGAIVGGHSARPGAYQYTVRLVSSGNSPVEGGYCGGTLVAPSVVLTAAHCVLANISGAKGRHISLPEDIDVLVGSSFLGAGELVHTREIIVHPKFDKPSERYDAALIILDHAVAVRTVPLTSASPRAGTSVSVAGWGAMYEWGNEGAVHLRAADLKVQTLTDCKRGNPPLGSVTFYSPTMMCASSPGRDTCTYDSGGPLVGYVGGRISLVGITSFGQGCAEPGHPGVYTRVSAIRAWTLSMMRDHA